MFSPACDSPLTGEADVCAGEGVLGVNFEFVALPNTTTGLPGVAPGPEDCCGAAPAIASVHTAAAAIVPARMVHGFRGDLTHRRIPNLRVLLLPLTLQKRQKKSPARGAGR